MKSIHRPRCRPRPVGQPAVWLARGLTGKLAGKLAGIAVPIALSIAMPGCRTSHNDHADRPGSTNSDRDHSTQPPASTGESGPEDQDRDRSPSPPSSFGDQDASVFILDSAVKMSPNGQIFSHIELPDYTASNPAWNGSAITLAGARGETVAFQVMVKAGAKPLTGVDAQLSALTSQTSEPSGGSDEPDTPETIDLANIQRFRQWYVEVTIPSYSPAQSTGIGVYPDALIPADVAEHGLPVDVAAGQIQGIWVDVTIPRDIGAGDYRGQVTVTAADASIARIDLALHVYNFDLPLERHLRWRVGYGGLGSYLNEHENIGYASQTGRESAAYRARERQLYRLAWSHRINPTTHYENPIPQHSGEGSSLRIDWTGFDQRFAAYFDGSAFDDGQPVNMISLPVNLQNAGGWPTGTRGTIDTFDGPALEAAVRQTVAHFRERNWPLENTFIYAADEPKESRYQVIDAACAAIRRASSEIPVSIAFYTQFGDHGRDIVERYRGCVSHWDIAGDFMDLPLLRAQQEAGDTVGFYQGSEPFQGSEALDADGLSLTTWPWIAWRYGLDHLFLYNMVEWSYFRLDQRERPWGNLPRDIWINPLNQSWKTNSQGVLVYPGHKIGYPGVVATIRLKQVRRGMQDYEYLWLLAERGQRALADQLATELVPRALHEAAAGFGSQYFGRGAWQRDPRAWAQARTQMAEELSR